MKIKNTILWLLLLSAGCQTNNDRVVVATSTTLGIAVAQNPATQLYEAKLGYERVELAFLPSNKNSTTNAPIIGNGAKDTPDVIMELSLRNIFAGGGVYQRLAIGSTAVAQPGAAFMFAKDQNGQLSTNITAVIQQALPLLLNRPTAH